MNDAAELESGIPIKELLELLAPALGLSVFEIECVQWKPLTDPGENFGSLMLAFDVTTTRDELLHLVAKLPPSTPYLLELFDSPLTFHKELNFYTCVAAAFESLWKECRMEVEEGSIAPHFVAGRLGLAERDKFDGQAVIILENLRFKGYKTGDRILGLDRQQVEFGLRALARLHASGIALKLKRPEFFRELVLEVLQRRVDETALRCVQDMVRKAWNDLEAMPEAKEYLTRIGKTIEYGDKADCAGEPMEEPWPTLVHQDFWVNNMMFQYEHNTSDIIDIKILDFQLCLYDFGAKDLIFFLISSVQKEILDNSLDRFMKYYHDRFLEYLKALDVDVTCFSWERFLQTVDHCGPIKFRQCIMMTQVIQATYGKEKDIGSKDGFLGRDAGDAYREKLLYVVRTFDRKGWLLK